MTEAILDNLSLVLYGKKDLRLEQTPVPECGPNDAFCKTHTCGICGTDIHLWDHGTFNGRDVIQPMCLGHEVSATVIKVGENVKHLKPGDRVAIETAIPCGKCAFCKEGRYNLCPISNLQAVGNPPDPGHKSWHGLLRRYFTHPADYCFKLPDSVSWEEGAMVEPLAVAVHAMRRLNITVGQTILICGSGSMGMLCTAVAKAYGAARIIVTDINQPRLTIAKTLGADETILIDPSTDKDPEVLAKKVQEVCGDPIDITLECTGVESSVKLAVFATRSGGKVGLIGLGGKETKTPLVNAALREVDIVGVCRFKNCYPMAIYLLAEKKINILPIVTHKFKLEDSMDAFNTMKNALDGALKVMIVCDN